MTHPPPPTNKKTIDSYIAEYEAVDPFCNNLETAIHDDYSFIFFGREFRVFISNVGEAYHCNIHGLSNPSNAEGFNTTSLSGAIFAAVRKFRSRCKTHIIQKLRQRNVDFSHYPVFVAMPPSKLRRALFPREPYTATEPTMKEKVRQLFLLQQKKLEDRIAHIMHVRDTVAFEEGVAFTFLGCTYTVDVEYVEESHRYQIVVYDRRSKKYHYTHNGPLDHALLCAKKEWVQRRLFDTKRRIKLRNRLEKELGSLT